MTRFVGLLLLASLAACSSSTGLHHLSFEGKSTVSPTVPMDVQTVVTVRNIGDKTTQIATNICGTPIRAFTTPERDGTPVWQSFDPAAMICAANAALRRLLREITTIFVWPGRFQPRFLPGCTTWR